MENNWGLVKVREVTHRVTKGTTPTTVGGRFTSAGIAFVKVESIAEDGSILSDKLAYIDENTNQLLARSVLQTDDILFTIAGTIGRVAQVKEDLLPANTNQAVAIVRPNHEVIEPRYLYYALRDKERVQQAHARVVQSVQANFSLTELSGIDVPLPPLPEQRRIAHILGTLDDKIELNRQMNQTLDELARTIFRSWFVDFDPVRAKAEGREPAGMDAETAALFPDRFVDSALGPIPEGSERRPLDEIGTFLNGLALQKYPPRLDGSDLPVIKIAQLRANSTVGADAANAEVPAQYHVEDGDFLFSWSGTLLAGIWSGGKGALNQHLFKVTSEDFPTWFVYHWVQEHLAHFRSVAADKATTMGHINRHHLSAAMCAVPSQDVLCAANRAIGPLMDLALSNALESRTLAELRDTLLPELLTGRIELGGRDER